MSESPAPIARRRVTMKEVAGAAGVSQASVSNAYNRPNKLSVAQREHILATAADLNYAGPDIVGSSLRSGKVGAIGLMVMDSLSYAFSDPSTVALLEGIVKVPEIDDFALTLIPLARRQYEPRTDGDPAEERGSTGLRGLVDGAVLHCLPDDAPALETLTARGIPMVIIDSPELEGIPRVCIEDRKAAFTQFSHVLELGHTRVGVIAERLRPDGYRGPATPERRALSVEHTVAERVAGYEAACLLHGIDFEAVPVLEAGGFTHEAGRFAACELLDNHDVTAIVCTSDEMALAALDEVYSRGLAVPGDVSVIGFDDAPGAAPAGLTTIHQPMVEKGRIAAAMLLRLLAGDQDVKTVTVPHKLVQRQSTGPARTLKSSPASHAADVGLWPTKV
jgi:DNA-binding LacI/PurR family transcriptional regulator